MTQDASAPEKRELSNIGRAPTGGSSQDANNSEFDKNTDKGSNLYATGGTTSSGPNKATSDTQDANSGNANGTASMPKASGATRGSAGAGEPMSMNELEPELNHLHQRLERLEQVSPRCRCRCRAPRAPRAPRAGRCPRCRCRCRCRLSVHPQVLPVECRLHMCLGQCLYVCVYVYT
jgi:hypothetical protein